MGSAGGEVDERPLAQVRIDKPFWMAACEVTNQMYAPLRPDPRQPRRGQERLPVRHPRLSDEPARAAGRPRVVARGDGVLPLALGEDGRAVRAAHRGPVGIRLPRGHGHAVLLRRPGRRFLASSPTSPTPSSASSPATPTRSTRRSTNPTKYDDWIPKDARFNDGALSDRRRRAATGPTPGACSTCTATPPNGPARATGRIPTATTTAATPATPRRRRSVRGGSWRDLPKRCTSSFRLGYLPYQRVYNVGFRVVCDPDAPPAVVAVPVPRR